jgi:hypothetical protein
MLIRPSVAQSYRSNRVDVQSHMLPSYAQHIKLVLQDNTLKEVAVNRLQQEVPHIPSAIFWQLFTTLAYIAKQNYLYSRYCCCFGKN